MIHLDSGQSKLSWATLEDDVIGILMPLMIVQVLRKTLLLLPVLESWSFGAGILVFQCWNLGLRGISTLVIYVLAKIFQFMMS